VRFWKRELWLAGLQPPLLKVVRAARLGPSFRIVPHVPEALRRIEPEQLPVPLFEEDCAFFRIGGKLVRIKTRQMPEVFSQVQMLLEQRMTGEPISVMSSDSQEQNALAQELLPADSA